MGRFKLTLGLDHFGCLLERPQAQRDMLSLLSSCSLPQAHDDAVPRVGMLQPQPENSSRIGHTPTINRDRCPTKLTIAIVLAGFARDYDQALTALANKVVHPNKENEWEVRVHAHTWDIDGRRLEVSDDVSSAGDDRYDMLLWQSETLTTISRAPADIDGLRAKLDGLGADSTQLEVESFQNVSKSWSDSLPHMGLGKFIPGKTRQQVFSKLGMWHGIYRAFAQVSPDVDLVVRSQYDLILERPVRALFRPSKLHAEATCSLFVKLGESTAADVFSGQPDYVSLDKRAPSVVANREALYERLSTQRAALAPTVTDGFPTNSSHGLVLAIPMRMNGDDAESIAEDMFAVGSYAAVQQHCVSFSRLNYLLQLLWRTPADRPLRGEDIVVLNAAIAGVHLELFNTVSYRV